MAHRYELLRLMFETNKKTHGLVYTPENLVVKTRANRGHKLQQEQSDFNYNRSMIAVSIDSEMLEQNISKVTGEKLVLAAAKVAEQNRKVNENNLSA